jgi:hypothetical protein
VALTATTLPVLTWEESRPTIDTLRRYLQILGKIRLASSPPREHSWNAGLTVTPRGLTTGLLRHGEDDFEIELDMVGHAISARTTRGTLGRVEIDGSASVASVYGGLTEMLAADGIRPTIRPVPYGLADTTPFPEDLAPRPYDPAYIAGLSEALRFGHAAFSKFAGRAIVKTSPVFFFWHSLDLVLTRHLTRPNATSTDEPQTEETIAFGFWPGDLDFPQPSFYSYMTPEPPRVAETALAAGGVWAPQGDTHLALLSYENIRASEDPHGRLLDFLDGAYQAEARLAAWPVDALRSKWSPEPPP